MNDVYADAVVTVILKTESGDCPGNTGEKHDFRMETLRGKTEVTYRSDLISLQ